MYKQDVTVDSTQSLTLTKDDSTNQITVKSGSGKTTETLTKNSVKVIFNGVNPTNLGTNATYIYTYRTFYPDYGYYISSVEGPGGDSQNTVPLWCTAWDGGECEYTEYYNSTGNGTHALLKLCILGSLDIRYFGTENTSNAGGWQIITKTDFNKNLGLAKGSGGTSEL